ncbi:hypothetical protein [Enterococcus sp. DIV1271a]|uniref:hypothetical protein n=1 Tax=Enterococcus sp. DIV1271a TaxID=2815327 RepID=UPI001A9B0357|nr:hypothetical protein [Enterococcus sp. DIV1271a]MBO1300877.1 hypothetical protein [Enterococcus sp. DIV1271a]
MFYKKYEEYLKEYINKDISIKSVKPHEEKIFNDFRSQTVSNNNPETLREEFHFVLDLISSRKEVAKDKSDDLKKSFETMLQDIDPSAYDALRFSIYKSRMIVLKENRREQETRTNDAQPTFTSNTPLQASDELARPKLVGEQEKRFAEQTMQNKRGNVKQEGFSNQQIEENVTMHENYVQTTNQSTKVESHKSLKVSDLKAQFEKEPSYNKEPYSAEVPSGTVNRLRQYYEGLNHSPLERETRKSPRWRASQSNHSATVQNRKNQSIDRQRQRNEGASSYQKAPPLKSTSEFVRRGNESTVYTNDLSTTNKAESHQDGMTKEEFQRRRDQFENMPGPSNEPPVTERTNRREPDNYQTAAYQNPPRQQRSSELVQESKASTIDNIGLRADNAGLSETGRANEEFQRRRDQFENMPGPSNEPPVTERTNRREPDSYQTAAYQNPPRQQRSSELVQESKASTIDNIGLRVDNAGLSQTGRADEEFQKRHARFENMTSTSNEPSLANKTKLNQTGLTNEEFQKRRARFENPSVKSDNRLAPESTGRVKSVRDQFEKTNVHSNERPVPESTGRVKAARDQFEHVNELPNERPVPESTGRVKAARDQFEKANELSNERPVPESTGRVKAARDQFENASNPPTERPVPESTGQVEAMRRQYESRIGRETEASISNGTLQQQNSLANKTIRQRRAQVENPAVTSSDGQKSEETVTADQLARRNETSNQSTAPYTPQTDQTGIVAGNTKKISELLADKLKFNPIEKAPPETNTQTDSSNVPVEESSSDTQNSQMRNRMSEGGEPKPTKLDESSIATRGMDKKQSQNANDPLDKLGMDASSDTFGLNENVSEKADKGTETNFMDDDVELPGSGPLTEKKKIHTKKSRAIQIGRILLNLLPLASWPLISMWVTGILGIVPAYLAMYGLPLTLFIYGTILTAVYGPKLINYIRKLRSRIQTYRQAERNRQRNLEDRVIDPKEKSIQREPDVHKKESAKTKQQNHSSEKVSPENPEKDKSVKGYFKRNWKSLAIIFGVGIVVAGVGVALTPVVAPYIFAIATSTPLFMYKVTSIIAMALAVSFGVTALSKGLHALQRKFYKKEDQSLETTTQKETIEKNSIEVDKNFDKSYEKVDKDDRAPTHDNSSIKSAGFKEDGIKIASTETKSLEKSPYAWVYGQETENKTPNESNRSSRSNSFDTHETLHVKADIHEPPSQSSCENRTKNQLGEAARHRSDNTKSESNPQIAEQNKGINRQPAVKEAFDSIKQKAISKSNNVSGKPLLKGQISFEK